MFQEILLYDVIISFIVALVGGGSIGSILGFIIYLDQKRKDTKETRIYTTTHYEKMYSQLIKTITLIFRWGKLVLVSNNRDIEKKEISDLIMQLREMIYDFKFSSYLLMDIIGIYYKLTEDVRGKNTDFITKRDKFLATSLDMVIREEITEEKVNEVSKQFDELVESSQEICKVIIQGKMS